MSAGHDHSHAVSNESVLKRALLLSGSFLIAEVIGGLLTNSLALLSDAAHMLTDVASLIIALIAIRIARKPADARRTFGYYRFEILSAIVNAVLLLLAGAYILYEAIERFRNPPEVASTAMLVIAVLGLFVNMISMRLLQSGAQSSLNMKGAYLEVWSDMLGSVGVIAAALVIRFTGWWQADPLIAVLIGLWVLPRTWTLLSDSINVLLEGVPEGLDLAAIESALASTPGVLEVHDLHVWSISSDKPSLTAHLCVTDANATQAALQSARDTIREKFGIAHCTIQVELPEAARDHARQCPLDSPATDAPPNSPETMRR